MDLSALPWPTLASLSLDLLCPASTPLRNLTLCEVVETVDNYWEGPQAKACQEIKKDTLLVLCICRILAVYTNKQAAASVSLVTDKDASQLQIGSVKHTETRRRDLL
jgi:hypothetical protein